jgi:hypothetical protein
MDLNAPVRPATAPRPVNNRARATNKPQRMSINGRTAVGRRVRDLAEGFVAQLGGWPGLSDTIAANVRKAAELTALAERTRAEALRNGNIDPLALVRLEGAANRAVRALNLDRKPAPAGPTLTAYLASLRGAEPQEASDEEPKEEAPDNETRTSELPNGTAEASLEGDDEASA